MADKIGIPIEGIDTGMDILGNLHPDTWNAIKASIAPNPFTSMANQASSPPAQILTNPMLRYSSMGTATVQPQAPAVTSMKPLLGRLPASSTQDPTTLPQKSFLGKIGGVLGKIGDVVGNATLGAANMSEIPGTRQFKEREEERQLDIAKEQAMTGAEKARADFEVSEAQKNRRGELPAETPEQLAAEFNKLYPGDPNDPERQKLMAEYALTRKITPERAPAREGKPEVLETPQGAVTIERDAKGNVVATPIKTAPEPTPAIGNPLEPGYVPPSTIAGQPVAAASKTPVGSFEEQAYQQELKNHPDLTREQFMENKENRIGARQEANQDRAFQHQEQLLTERQRHAQEVASQRENQLTAPTRTMIEMAPQVKTFVDRVEQLTKQEADGLGPLKGRWSEFMTGKVGAPNPEYAKLKTDITLLRTALLKMHVGSRGSQIMLQEFKDILDQGKDSPENMLAALGEIGTYADDLISRGKGGGESSGGGEKVYRAINPATGQVHEGTTPPPKGWKIVSQP